VLVVVLLLVAAIVVAAEFVVRDRASAALADASTRLPDGTSVTLDGIRIPDDGSFTVSSVDVSGTGVTAHVRVPLATAIDLAD
jgi:hypothetical protein